jgi:hypothetical protein
VQNFATSMYLSLTFGELCIIYESVCLLCYMMYIVNKNM